MATESSTMVLSCLGTSHHSRYLHSQTVFLLLPSMTNPKMEVTAMGRSTREMRSSRDCVCGKTPTITASQNHRSCTRCPSLELTQSLSITNYPSVPTNLGTSSAIAQKLM